MGSDFLTFGLSAELFRKTVQPGDMATSCYIGLEHINQGSLSLNGHGISSDVSSAKSAFSRGDILFGKLRPYFRKVILAPFDGLCSTDIWVVRSKKGVDQKFLFYWMASQEFVNFSMQGAEGTRMPRAKWEHVSRHAIPYIDISEQRAIAHILGSLDDKIELNRKTNETLEAMAQAIFKSWFVDFDPVIDNALAAGNPIPDELQDRAAVREALGGERKPLPEDIRKLFPSEFYLTEEMGWVPKGWIVKPIDKVIDVNPKVTLKKNTIAPFVDMKALPTTGFSIMEISEKAYSGGAKFYNGDVLLARITPCLENGKTGIVDFLNENSVGFGSTEFIVLRGKKGIHTTYVACLSRLTVFRNHCIQNMVGSSGRQRVQNSCFSNYFVALPSNAGILSDFDNLTRKNFNKVSKNSEQTRTLILLRDTLLPRLISGEIRIPDAEKLAESAA